MPSRVSTYFSDQVWIVLHNSECTRGSREHRTHSIEDLVLMALHIDLKN